MALRFVNYFFSFDKEWGIHYLFKSYIVCSCAIGALHSTTGYLLVFKQRTDFCYVLLLSDSQDLTKSYLNGGRFQP